MVYGRKKGSTGKIIVIILVVILCIAIVAAFIGVQPLAAYKDKMVNMISPYLSELKNKSDTEINLPQLPPTMPNGTYTNKTYGHTSIVTFSGKTVTLEADHPIWGKTKAVAEYSFPDGIESGKIQIKDIFSGEIGTLPFIYNKEHDCFMLDKLQYCK